MKEFISGATVLLFLKNDRADDWASLCHAFGIDSRISGSSQRGLLRVLHLLKERGFIEMVECSAGRQPRGRISLTSLWETIQPVLGVSLEQIADPRPVGYQLTNPFLGLPREPERSPDVFVLMPSESEILPVYDEHIAQVCREFRITVGRVDDFFEDVAKIGCIWNSINGAKVVIADCTGKNAGVFYELGICHTLGKPTILISQDRSEAPLDVRHIFRIIYEFTPSGMRTFQGRLRESLPLALRSRGGRPSRMPWEWGPDVYS